MILSEYLWLIGANNQLLHWAIVRRQVKNPYKTEKFCRFNKKYDFYEKKIKKSMLNRRRHLVTRLDILDSTFWKIFIWVFNCLKASNEKDILSYFCWILFLFLEKITFKTSILTYNLLVKNETFISHESISSSSTKIIKIL